MNEIHPDNANELALIAEEVGADVLHGSLTYPSETGWWQLGDVDLQEHLARYKDQELVFIIAPVGKAENRLVYCGICGLELDEPGECPHCRRMVERDARRLEQIRRKRQELFADIERYLGNERE